MLVSRAPIAVLQAYRKRMGWDIPWYSSFGTSFNPDFGRGPETPQPGRDQDGEMFGLSAFIRDGDSVYRTYFTSNRGVEALGPVWTLLDLTALGRQEEWEDAPEGTPQTPLSVVAPPRRLRRIEVSSPAPAASSTRGSPPSSRSSGRVAVRSYSAPPVRCATGDRSESIWFTAD